MGARRIDITVGEWVSGKGLSHMPIRALYGLRLPSFSPLRINFMQKRGYSEQVFCIRGVCCGFR